MISRALVIDWKHRSLCSLLFHGRRPFFSNPPKSAKIAGMITIAPMSEKTPTIIVASPKPARIGNDYSIRAGNPAAVTSPETTTEAPSDLVSHTFFAPRNRT